VLGSLLFTLRSSRTDGFVAIAQLNQISRYVVVRRDDGMRDFDWIDLRGSVIFVPSQLPTAWAAFREMLDPAQDPAG
jgi:hypothetical protein